MANKILIPLHSLIYCFLNPLQTGRWQWVQLGESGRGYSPVWPGGCTTHGALVAVAQAAGGSSGLNLLCAKDQANENCEHRSGILAHFPADYEGDSLAHSSPAFSFCPSTGLSICATAYKILGRSESCV